MAMVPLVDGDNLGCIAHSAVLLPSGDAVSYNGLPGDGGGTHCHRYIRHLDSELSPELRTEIPLHRKRLFAQMSFGRISPNPLSFLEFFRPLIMLKYPSVGLLALSWCLGVAMPDIGISNIVPLAFGEVYGWSPSAQGLSNAGFLVGCFLGEAFAGGVSDWVHNKCSHGFCCCNRADSSQYIRWRMKRNGGVFIPEMRLIPTIPGLILMPFGLAGFGICVQHKTHWMGPVSMMVGSLKCRNLC